MAYDSLAYSPKRVKKAAGAIGPIGPTLPSEGPRGHFPSVVGPPADVVPGTWALYVEGQSTYSQWALGVLVREPEPKPMPLSHTMQSVTWPHMKVGFEQWTGQSREGKGQARRSKEQGK